MKNVSFILSYVLFGTVTLFSQEVTLFTEYFNSPDSLDAWNQYSTNEGRIAVVQDPNSELNSVLLLDDETSNATYSKNVLSRQISLQPLYNPYLTVDLRMGSDEADVGDGQPVSSASPFDGLVMELSSGEHVAIPTSDLLNGIPNYISLRGYFSDKALALADFLTLQLHQYDNDSFPDDGLIWDNLRLSGTEQQLIIAEPPEAFQEGEDILYLPVTMLPVPEADTPLQLMDGSMVLGEAIFPAGETTATLLFANLDDNEVEGNNIERLHLTDGQNESDRFDLYIVDNEAAGLSITLPATIDEYGGYVYGDLAISANPHAHVRIELFSSHPELLSVFDRANIPESQNQSQFRITPVRDPLILGTREVTITARCGLEEVSETILFVEGNSRDPQFSGPDEIQEGRRRTLTVGVNTVSDNGFRVQLSSSDTRLQLSTNELVMGPGVSSMQVELMAVDDNIVERNRTVVISAVVDGGGTGEFIVPVIDNDVHQYALPLPDFLPKGQVLETTLSGINMDGDVVFNQSDPLDFVLLDTLTGSEIVLLDDYNYSGGEIQVAIPISPEAAGNSLLIRSTDGREFNIGIFDLIDILDFPCSTISYDKTRDRLYAFSALEGLPGYLQSLTPIDPGTRQLGTPLFIGGGDVDSDSAITEDGKYLYIGLGDARAVQKVNLESFSKDSSIPLKAIYGPDPYLPVEIMTIPGRPDDFIITRRKLGSTGNDVRAYFDGEQQVKGVNEEWALVPNGNTGEFFGCDVGSSNHYFHKAILTDDGFEILDTAYDIPFIWAFNMAVWDGRVITSSGTVLDAGTLDTLYQLDFEWDILDSGTRPQIFLEPGKSRLYVANYNVITVYDLNTCQEVEMLEIPGIDRIEQLFRYGDIGLVARTLDQKLVFLESARLVPRDDAANIQVDLTLLDKKDSPDGYLDYSCVIANRGEATAEGILLTIYTSENVILDSSNQEASTSQPGLLTFNVARLALGESTKITFRLNVTQQETAYVHARVSSMLLDPDYSDNVDSSMVLLGYRPSPDSLSTIKSYARCIAYDEIRGNLLLGTGKDAPKGFKNCLLAINIQSGLLSWMNRLPGEPERLSLSDDRSTVFVLGDNQKTFHRLDASQGYLEKSFQVEASYVLDFEVLQGTNDSLVIGGDHGRGIQIYDDGVLRNSTSDNNYGSEVLQIEGTDYIFGQDSQDSYLTELSADGLELVQHTRSILYSSHQNIVKAGNLAFDPSGRVADMLSMTFLGSLPIYESMGNDGDVSIVPELDKKRIYVARGDSIGSFDADTFLNIRVEEFPLLYERFITLIRWGTDGFIGLLEYSGDVVVIRSNIVSSGSEAHPIDLSLNLPNPAITDGSSIIIKGAAYTAQGIASVTIDDSSVASVDNYAAWTKSLDLEPGINEFLIKATPNGPGDPLEFTQVILYDPNLEIDGTFADMWAEAYFNIGSLPASWKTSDDDNDGYTAYEEYLFGMHPGVVDYPIFDPGLDPHSKQTVLAYRRLSSFREHYRVAISSNLTDWDVSESRISYLLEPFPCADDDRYEDVVFSLVDAGDDPVFIKIVVE